MNFITYTTYYDYLLDDFVTEKHIFKDREAKERNLIYQHLICKFGEDAQIDIREEL